MDRPEFYRFHQGDKTLPFAPGEYDARLALLRKDMESQGVTACLLTSMHNVAYYSGFLYCSFGRPYGWWSPPRTASTSAPASTRPAVAALSWRRNLTYTDWARDNFWRAVAHRWPDRAVPSATRAIT
jgi:creatinase